MADPSRPFPVVTPPRPPRKRRLLYLLQSALQTSGLGALYVRWCRIQGAVILMYHSVPDAELARWIDPRNSTPPSIFKKQMRFLASHRKVVSMSALGEMLVRGDDPEAGTVVITFDDGYLDNLRIAAPILKKWSLPATLYLPTGYIARAENQWVDRLYSMFRTRQNNTLQLNRLGCRWTLDNGKQVLDAYDRICSKLISSTWTEREQILSEVYDALSPRDNPPRLTMCWDDVRQLIGYHPLMEIGAHTVDHLDMSALDEPDGRREIDGAADAIEQETGQRPKHFSFPYGRRNEMSEELVEKGGYLTAVGSGTDYLVKSDAKLTALPRLEVPLSPTLFGFWTSGAYPDLPRHCFGRA